MMRYRYNDIPLKYAHTMGDIPNAFSPRPLKRKDDMENFYCPTMAVRTGKLKRSPIQDMIDACTTPTEHCAYLFLGHTGCGKSTELNRMADELREEGYFVNTVQCGSDLDLLNPVYQDLMILMGRALLKIAGDIGLTPSKRVRDAIHEFWMGGEKTVSIEDEAKIELESGITAETPAPVAKLLRLFFSVRADLKSGATSRTVYREKVEHQSSEWMSVLNQFTDEITEKLEGKRPVIIFEDLDKLDPENAWKVFFSHASTLSDTPFPVIYTFPIALYYDTRFNRLQAYFSVERLPMIKQETVDGQPYPDGFNTLKAIVERRADLSLFEEDALRTLIEKTGGSLRDLFRAIIACSRMAGRSYRHNRRAAEQINMDDVETALNEIQSDLTSALNDKYYAFLVEIYQGRRTRIQDEEKLLRMLEYGVVLEYNAKRWYNVHPLVADFLVEEGLVKAFGEEKTGQE